MNFHAFASAAVSLTVTAAFTALPPSPPAQLAPSSEGIAAYTSLHAAAQFGDVSAIQGTAGKQPAALEAVDRNSRMLLHVANFARQRGAVAELLDTGANSAAMDRGRYDAVSIAAGTLDTMASCGI